MLVLSRHVGESIIVNENITITVVNIRKNSIRIGIDAPPDISIHRQEIQERLAKENKNPNIKKLT